VDNGILPMSFSAPSSLSVLHYLVRLMELQAKGSLPDLLACQIDSYQPSLATMQCLALVIIQ
jgi:hypothetical protein